MTQKARLLSGRVPVTGPTTVTSDRYQFLGLDQAEPNLGTAANGNVLTTNIYGARIWSNSISLANLTAGNISSSTVTVSTGLFWANGTPFTAYGNVDVAGYLPIYTGNISAGNITITNNFRGNVFADVITPYRTGVTVFDSSTAIKLPAGDNSTRPTGVSGYIRYNTAGLAPEYYNGTDWISVTNTVTDQSFSGDGSSNIFTLDQAASQAGVLVSINGTLQLPGVAYTVSGTQITFAEIPLTTDVIDVRFLGALVNTIVSYGNSNVASYLTTATISTTGNVSANVLTANTLIVGGDLAVTGNVAGSNLTSKTTGSWTVATGTNTYSITVPASGTYQIWVRGSIPNGIITYVATAVVTNTNVPVVGAQYAWVYNGGGTPIDFTSIPNQFTGTGNTIVRSSTAPSATTNKFDFGINNTSGSSQTVYWGYIALG
jgi:hypothetical protein